MTNLSTIDYLENFTVSKSLNDRMWKLDFSLDKDEAPAPMTGVRAFATDHASVEHCLFVGFIPGADYIRQNVNNKVDITAYDFSWYLSAQKVPEEYWEMDMRENIDYWIVYDLLGGSNDLNVTGVTLGTVFYNDDNNQYQWSPQTTKIEAIEDLANTSGNYLMFVFEDAGGGVYQTTMYYTWHLGFIPSEVAFTSPSDYIIGIMTHQNSLEDYNRVTVYGTNPWDGTWFTKTEETAAVAAEEEKPIEYVYQDAKLYTQAMVDAKASSLYSILHSVSAATYTATLTNRYDLRLFQKVKFIGYSNIPEISMRIVSISYQRVLNDDKVVINFAADQSFDNLKLLARYTENNLITTQQQIVNNAISGLAHLSIGTVTDVSGNEATLEMERTGNTIKARILS